MNKKDYTDALWTIPNFISMFRIIGTIILLIYLIINGIEDKVLILTILIILAISDTLDGFIARTFNMKSRLGSVLDPIGDKIYNWGIGVYFIITGIMPIWVLIILIRDITVGAITTNYFIKTGIEMLPTIPAKLKMVFQSIALIATFIFGFGNQGLELIAPVFIILAILSVIPEIILINKRIKKGV
ncbi:MAG: CDP-alcohol phosphatidyltransferase family protein [Bacilli bacterium]